ncbi:MAG: hypothetical protein Q7R59_01875 [bacterium]|nr:hypothetical protein [bacterium]
MASDSISSLSLALLGELKMQILILFFAFGSVLVGGVLIDRSSYGSGAAAISIGLILGMVHAAQTVAQIMITLR